MSGTLAITGDDYADRLLNTSGTAVLIGMLLDQQVPMEWAFHGPATLSRRLGHLDAASIAAMDLEVFVAVCCDKPAIHRFPAVMGRRIYQMCQVLVEAYGGEGSGLWSDGPDAATLFARIRALPGYGQEKSMIFLALLAKRFGVRPDGWEELAGPFGDDAPRSAADIDGEKSLARVREWKRLKRAAGKTKQD